MAKKDMVALFCKGKERRFRGIVCKHYDTDADECRLFRERPMRDVFEKGRCEPYEMLKRAVRRNLYGYSDRIAPEEHIEPTTFLTSVRIKKKGLKHPKLPVLKAYINRSAYNDVIELLMEEGVLWPSICGICVHLSVPKPHVCQREHIMVDGKRIENPHHGETRIPSSQACKKGFEPPVFEENFDIPGPEPDSPVIIEMKTALTKRIKGETNKNVRRKHERQYVVFCRFVRLNQEGYSEREALERIAEVLGVSLRTVERDMAEIRNFLREVMSFYC